MTDQALAVVAAFQACGGEAEALPPSDEETLDLGRSFTSGKECYPCILTTGDMAKTGPAPGFRPGQERLFHALGDGPCRFGQYHRFHRLVLDDLGYPQVPIYSPDQNENLYQELGMVGGDFSRMAWKGMVAIDLLEKKLRETRPYESIAGETDRSTTTILAKVCPGPADPGRRDRGPQGGPADLRRRVPERQRRQARDRGGGGNLHPVQPVLQRKRGPGDRGLGR